MLTSFGCEQIVQVRATEFDSKSAGPAALQLRSITGPGVERNREKGPSIAGVTRPALIMRCAWFAGASRTPPWLLSEWGKRGLSTPRGENGLRREVHPAQQVLEARVRAQFIEPKIGPQQYHEHRPLPVGSFQPTKRLVFLV